jgi:hypothetical protein
MLFTRNKQKNELPADVKVLRGAIVGFIKKELQKYDGGEAGNLNNMELFIDCTDSERQVYEAAVYLHDKDRLKNEVQKIADDYAIDLPGNWSLATLFDKLPEASMKNANGTIGLLLTGAKANQKQPGPNGIHQIRVAALNGHTEQQTYDIHSTDSRVNIGRGHTVELPDGSVRVNQISFAADSSEPANKYVSRHHAHINWDEGKKRFLVYPDAGGIPPANKTKIKNAKSGQVYKLQAADIGYALSDYDQLILGDSAVLEVRFP